MPSLVAAAFYALLTLNFKLIKAGPPRSGAPPPPPLSTLAGTVVSPDENPRDVPAITNFWGSVGSASGDILSLSQIQLPPFLDQGVATGVIRVGASPPCSPESMNPWTIGDDDQYFFLVNSTPSMRFYNLTCTTAGCTSWHTATATMPAPFTSFHITYDEIPPHPPFADNGMFDASCTVISYRSGDWCASHYNPTCTPQSSSSTLEGWQWTPTGVLRWGGPALSETRMMFEGAGVLQRVSLTAPPAELGPLAGVSIELTGAMRVQPAQGWTVGIPGTTAGYTAEVVSCGGGSPALLTCDSVTPACAAWVVADVDAGGAAVPWNFTLSPGSVTGVLSLGTVPPAGVVTLLLALVVAQGPNATLQAAHTVAGAVNFTRAWDGFASGWEARWVDAFTPKGPDGAGHFSGSLPILQLEESQSGAALQRMYYMSALAILLAERTNLPKLFPRVYVTGTGNAMCGIFIGGTEQFAWDQTFYGMLMALLDPAAARADLLLWVGQPISQHYALELDNLSVNGDFYAFNALSLFRAFSTYSRVTNDTAFVASTEAYVEQLADFYLPYVRNSSSTLADYSGNPANYLECVPTYRHATAGLQVSRRRRRVEGATAVDLPGLATREA
jgi:hypothetical protein